MRRRRRVASGEGGQALLIVLGGLTAVLVAAFVLGGLARGIEAGGGDQRAADLAALAGAKAMQDGYDRLFEPPRIAGGRNPRHLSKTAYLALGRGEALRVARANGAPDATVEFPDRTAMAPVRVRVVVHDRIRVPLPRSEREVSVRAHAEAELAPPIGNGPLTMATGGGYNGPLAYRQGKPMRPDVALAFDRMYAAARADGVTLSITSAYRSDAEQAALFRANPNPRMVAPAGQSLHRMGTELDLGPPGAWGWLSRNARRFHFVQRYRWEAWHYGYTLNQRSATSGLVRIRSSDGRSAVPSFVPARFAPFIIAAAQRWNVSAALISAQIYAESNFNPFAVSPVGAQGIAQFMPGTARAYGLRNPFDARAAIDAQAHMMRDLLRQFGAIPLALAAYNAGPGAVAGCHCIPPYPETRGYVARILGLLRGAGDLDGLGADAFTVRLVR